MAEKEKEAKESTEIEVKSPTSKEVAAPGRGALRPFWDLDTDFDRLFENFFHRGWLSPLRMEMPSLRESFGEKMPKVNVIEREDEFQVEAELPGMEKDDVEVSVTPSSLTIKASTRKETKEEKGDYHRREIHAGHYSRTLPLPSGVETDKTKAKFKNGVLTLTMPKSEEAKTRSIKID